MHYWWQKPPPCSPTDFPKRQTFHTTGPAGHWPWLVLTVAGRYVSTNVRQHPLCTTLVQQEGRMPVEAVGPGAQKTNRGTPIAWLSIILGHPKKTFVIVQAAVSHPALPTGLRIMISFLLLSRYGSVISNLLASKPTPFLD